MTDNKGATSSTTHTVSVKEVTYHQVGETVNNGCIKFTLRSVSKAGSISIWTPDPGNHYVIVDVKIEAVKDDQLASMLFNSELEDDEKRVYDVSVATSALDHYFDSANLDTGQWTDGKSAYEANKNSAFYILIYESISCPAIKYKFSV